MRETAGASDGEHEDGSRSRQVGRPIRSDFRFVIIGPISASGLWPSFSSFRRRLLLHFLSRHHFLKEPFPGSTSVRHDGRPGFFFFRDISGNYQTIGPSAGLVEVDIALRLFPWIPVSQRLLIFCHYDKSWLDDNLGGRLSREIALMVVLIVVVDLVSCSNPFSGTP